MERWVLMLEMAPSRRNSALPLLQSKSRTLYPSPATITYPQGIDRQDVDACSVTSLGIPKVLLSGSPRPDLGPVAATGHFQRLSFPFCFTLRAVQILGISDASASAEHRQWAKRMQWAI